MHYSISLCTYKYNCSYSSYFAAILESLHRFVAVHNNNFCTNSGDRRRTNIEPVRLIIVFSIWMTHEDIFSSPVLITMLITVYWFQKSDETLCIDEIRMCIAYFIFIFSYKYLGNGMKDEPQLNFLTNNSSQNEFEIFGHFLSSFVSRCYQCPSWYDIYFIEHIFLFYFSRC